MYQESIVPCWRGYLCHDDVIKWKYFTVPGEFPAQRPVTRSFDVFFDLRLNKRLSKQSWSWWFETLSHPLWRHRNVILWGGYFSIRYVPSTQPPCKLATYSTNHSLSLTSTWVLKLYYWAMYISPSIHVWMWFIIRLYPAQKSSPAFVPQMGSSWRKDICSSSKRGAISKRVHLFLK